MRGIAACSGVLLALACGCSAAPEPAGRVAAIVGGAPASDPAVVLVSQRSGALCTGTLVAEKVVLTAKHCVQAPGDATPVRAEELIVGVGDTFDGLTSVYDVARVFTTAGAYEPGGPTGIGVGIEGQDVALLVLTAPTGIPAIPIRAAAPRDLVGATGRAVGFGRTPSGDSGEKNAVDVRIEEVGDQTIVTGPATCRGDSGGPLFGPDGDVIGVTSFQLGTCGTGTAHFNRLDIHADLVASAVAAAGSCTPSGAEICDAIDNDCNGRVDETCAALGEPCGASEDCARLGICEDTAVGRICTLLCDPLRPTFGCGAGLYCALAGYCAGRCLPGTAGGAPFGASCSENTDCASLLCTDPGDGRRRCATPCRGDAGMCRGGEVCAADVVQCGGCVTDGWAGQHGQGEPCDEDGQCYSLNCGDDNGVRYCARFCDADDTCGGGFHCRDGECVRGDREAAGGSCTTDGDCRESLLCDSFMGVGFCTAACGSDADCPAGFGCGTSDTGPACIPDLALLGEPCAAAMDCITALCAETSEGQVCTQRCGADAPCPPAFACIAPEDGSQAVCVRPPPSPPVGGDDGGCAVGQAPSSGGAPFAALLLLLGLIGRRRR